MGRTHSSYPHLNVCVKVFIAKGSFQVFQTFAQGSFKSKAVILLQF